MRSLSLLLLLLCCACQPEAEETTVVAAAHYLENRTPLAPSAYLPLPLGAIQPQGWLKENLQRMATGMTGQLDERYPEVIGDRNGWLGGDGDGWERGPYWVDGLLPLAYLLDDDDLKNKAHRWVEWTLTNQAEDGYLGPVPFSEEPAYEPGLQKTDRTDWWPKMVMLKVLQQYYGATEDQRVIDVLSKYFKYQLRELPERPLDFKHFWANRRGADNLLVVHWLYNLTGEEYLLDLAALLEEQTFPWDQVFTNDSDTERSPRAWSYFTVKYPFDSTDIQDINLADQGSIHCVNLAQGLKQPALMYQGSGDKRYLAALKRGLRDVKRYHGQVQGMFGGDEPLHGTNPTHGVEFCAVSEEMFSLETILQVTGDVAVADLLERIAYNALPTQATDNFNARQYFQAANQIELAQHVGHSFEGNNHDGTDFVYGERSGYVCCTANMHQSWPKFVQNLFYATPDRGVAALQYGPAQATLLVGDRTTLTIRETTGYPFRDRIKFTLSMDKQDRFPFHLRIPAWTEDATVTVNGEEAMGANAGAVKVVERDWSDGDVIELQLPMPIRTSTWHEFSKAVERGPLVYALGVPSSTRAGGSPNDVFKTYTEHRAAAPWNFGLINKVINQPAANITVVERDWDGSYPWNLETAPVALSMKGIRVREWQAANGVPHLPAFWGRYNNYRTEDIQQITLVPYGCTTLRISTFPAYNLPEEKANL